MKILSYKYKILSPLIWYFIGYLLWMFIPPFFTKNGHHPDGVLADLVGIIFFSIGAILGPILHNLFFKKLQVRVDINNAYLFLISLALIIYTVKLDLLNKYGIYAFLHPLSRPSSLPDTIALQLEAIYITLAMVLYFNTKKYIFLLLIILEMVLFIIPSLAKSYYILYPIYYSFIIYFYSKNGLNLILKRFLPAIIFGVFLISIFAPYINAVRSFVEIGQYESGLALDLRFDEDKTKFIINRLNIHGEIFNFEPVITEAVYYDKMAFKSMQQKWFGFYPDYYLHPTTVSNTVGKIIGYGKQTSTDVPRNYILYNYHYGVFLIIIFNLLLGLWLSFIYELIFNYKNYLFIPLWISLVFSPAFSAQGSFPSTFIFQYIFLLFSVSLAYILFLIIKVTKGKLLPYIQNSR